MTTKKSASATLYPTVHMGPKKKPAKNALLTHPVTGTAKVPQQQKPAIATTAKIHNAAAVKR